MDMGVSDLVASFDHSIFDEKSCSLSVCQIGGTCDSCRLHSWRMTIYTVADF
jgi:hypothetical protein